MKKALSAEELEKFVDMYENTWMTIDEMSKELDIKAYYLKKEITQLRDEGRLSTENRKDICKRNLMKAIADLVNIGMTAGRIRWILNVPYDVIKRRRKECAECGMIDNPHILSTGFDFYTIACLRARGVSEESIRQYSHMPDADLHVLITYLDRYCKDKLSKLGEDNLDVCEKYVPNEPVEEPTINVKMSVEDLHRAIYALQGYMRANNTESSFIGIEKLINNLANSIPKDPSDRYPLNVESFYNTTLKFNDHLLIAIERGISNTDPYDIYKYGCRDIEVDPETLCSLVHYYKKHNESLKGFTINNPYLVDNKAIIKDYELGKSIPTIAADNNTTEDIVGFIIWRYQNKTNKSTDTDAKEVHE